MPYDRLLIISTGGQLREIPSQERDGAVIRLRDKKGVLRRTFDFSSLNFERRLAEVAARFFYVRYGSRTIETQSLAWRACRNLAEAISDPEGQPIRRLPKDAISKLRCALLERGLKPKVAQSRINVGLELIGWSLRNAPQVVAKGVTTMVPTLYADLPQEARPTVPEDVVKCVLTACYNDIEEIERTQKLGQRLGVKGALVGNDEKVQAVHQLLIETKGKIPSRRKLNHRLTVLVDVAGGLREVTKHVRLTPTQIFPFYLAILAQTGANPMALRRLRRDCVSPHPLVSHLERIVWDKPRAGKEQYVDFPEGKIWSAPNLVRRLAALNHKLVSAAHVSDREYLFLAQGTGAPTASVLSWAYIHLLLDKFIARHELPNFDLAGFRTHVAKAHHATAGSLIAAKERLNHVELRTTSRYTPLGDRATQHDQIILAFQGRMVREARGEQSRWESHDPAKNGEAHETLFGFQCSDPYGGTAHGSVAGKLCLQFQKCATCPGALIPLDNVRVVAKLLATAKYLDATSERAKKEGWMERFNEIYEPVLRILMKELLPAISTPVRAKAEKIVSLQVLPHLE